MWEKGRAIWRALLPLASRSFGKINESAKCLLVPARLPALSLGLGACPDRGGGRRSELRPQPLLHLADQFVPLLVAFLPEPLLDRFSLLEIAVDECLLP